MSRALKGILLLGFLILLIGCNGNDNTPDDCVQYPDQEGCTEEDSVQINTIATNFSINVTKEDMIGTEIVEIVEVVFKSVTYDPLDLSICATVVLTDMMSGVDERTFFIALQEKGNIENRSITQISTFERTKTISECFTIPDKDKDYHILVGKIESFNTIVRASAALEWEDKDLDNRSFFGVNGFTNITAQTTTMDEGSNITFGFSLRDAEGTIDTVHYYILDSQSQLVDDFMVTKEEHGGSSLTDYFKTISGLSPTTEYRINVYVSGNDGVYDFDDKHVASEVFISSNIQGREHTEYDTYHGFYSFIHDIDVHDGMVEIDYFCFNSEDNETYSEPKQYLLVLDETDLVLHKIPLVPGDNTISIPETQIDKNNHLRLIEEQSDSIQDETEVPSFEPEIDIPYTNGGEFSIILNKYYDSITNITVEVIIPDYAIVLETFTGYDPDVDNPTTTYHDMSMIDSYMLRVTITYDRFGRSETIVKETVPRTRNVYE